MSIKKLLAEDENEYDSDLFASSADTMEALNPGLGLDVPPGTVSDAVKLHDSMFSQGVSLQSTAIYAVSTSTSYARWRRRGQEVPGDQRAK